MIIKSGYLLTARDEAADSGLWFILYADAEGALAIDLSREHPDIGYSSFEAALKFTDLKPETEQVVLLGGIERSFDALVILHETRVAMEESNRINDDFSFLSYNYVPIPGKPPRITTPDNRPSEIKFKAPSSFLVSMGYRIFSSALLKDEIAAGEWLYVPAPPDVVFNTSRHERKAKLLQSLN